MTEYEIGLGYRGDKPMREYGPLAARAEQLGFDVITVFGDLLFQPPLGPLLEMARATSRVRLGAACWNPYTLHPAEIAGQLAVLDDLSGGRAFLGLARGSWMGTLGLKQERPLARLHESIDLIRALITGDESGYDGQLVALAPGAALRHPRPKAMPPILIGTWGARTAELAAQLADEVKIGGTTNPRMVATMREWLSAGARRANRDPSSIGVVTGAVTVVDTDGELARRHARTEAAMYVAVVADLDPTIEVPAGLVHEVQHRLDAGDAEGAGDLLPDDLLRLFSFAGTPQEVAAQAQVLLDAGARRVEFGPPHGLTAERGVELLGTEVLPRLRPGRPPRG